MREHVHLRVGRQQRGRPNHHSTHADGTPRRGGRPTATIQRGAATRNRNTSASPGTSTPGTANTSILGTLVPVVVSSPAVVLSTQTVASSSRQASLPIVMSSARSSTLTSQSSASSSGSIVNAEASSSPSSTTPKSNNAYKIIPAVVVSLFVVLAAVGLVFCLHRRRKLAQKRDAITSEPSPYTLNSSSDPSFDEKGYAYNNDHDHMREKEDYYAHDLPQEQQYYNQHPSTQEQHDGHFSILTSIRNTFLRRKSTRRAEPSATNHPWDWQDPKSGNRAESPPIPKVPVLTQVPSTTHDPFRDGFGPGASQLATGLANTTMTSQISADSHSSLSHKQSLSSNASTSVARRWPNAAARDGHESLSQGPNVRTLYTGIQVEGTAEEDEEQVREDATAEGDVYADAYGYATTEDEEHLQTPSMRPGQHSIRTVSYNSTVDEHGRHLSQSTDGGQTRSIRFGTLRSQSDTGEELIEPAWQRS